MSGSQPEDQTEDHRGQVEGQEVSQRVREASQMYERPARGLRCQLKGLRGQPGGVGGGQE